MNWFRTKNYFQLYFKGACWTSMSELLFMVGSALPYWSGSHMWEFSWKLEWTTRVYFHWCADDEDVRSNIIHADTGLLMRASNAFNFIDSVKVHQIKFLVLFYYFYWLNCKCDNDRVEHLQCLLNITKILPIISCVLGVTCKITMSR